MPAEHDDLLGPETPCGDHATQTDGAVPDNGHCLARRYLRGNRGMMAGAHYVR
jgi:hypothetical protein